MAESLVTEPWIANIPCRYFANGMCREGERCRYLHQQGQGWTSTEPTSCGDHNKKAAVSNTDNKNPESKVCRFFQRGQCMYGANCYFSHDLSILSSSAEQQQNTIGNVDSSPLKDRPSSTSSSSSTSTVVQDDIEQGDDDNPEGTPAKSSGSALNPNAESWINAPEFIPSCISSTSQIDPLPEDANEPCSSDSAGASRTWAQVVNESAGAAVPNCSDFNKLCPYAEMGSCPYEERCSYLHGDICELCGNACLHPTDEDLRKQHTNECIKQHERDMELSFAIARSRDKQCGVCFEVVMEKNPASEQRFGILPNCNHCFCLACIRKWRQAKQFDNKIIRSCPECRVSSDYVCPSIYWVDTKEDKEKLIVDYKQAMSNKQCKYFKQGRGKCPFGNKCFYLHASPDGTKVDTGPPVQRRRFADNGSLDVLQELLLWDFLDERNNRRIINVEEFLLGVGAYLSEDDIDYIELDSDTDSDSDDD